MPTVDPFLTIWSPFIPAHRMKHFIVDIVPFLSHCRWRLQLGKLLQATVWSPIVEEVQGRISQPLPFARIEVDGISTVLAPLLQIQKQANQYMQTLRPLRVHSGYQVLRKSVREGSEEVQGIDWTWLHRLSQGLWRARISARTEWVTRYLHQ